MHYAISRTPTGYAPGARPPSPWRSRLVGLAVALALPGFGLQAAADPGADDPARADTVSWTVSAVTDPVAPGARLVLTLKGSVLDGWHVYGPKQLPNGPTPLHVAVEKNDVARTAGSLAASPAIKVHDASFGLDTQFYDRSFTVALPVRIGAHATGGPQQIPLSVKFQTCNGRICQPPKTVHVSASITVRTDG